MKTVKLFIENFLVYGIGGIISKIIPLIMLPIITRLMPNTSYYGISDLSNTVISFGSALAIMGMYDAMYRMFFENDDVDYKKDICSTALIFTIITSIIVSIFMIIFKNVISKYVFGDLTFKRLVYIAALATLVGSTNSIVSAPTRMQNKRRIFLSINLLSSFLSYGIAIPLLLQGYYIIALPLAAVFSGISSELIFFCLNKKWFNLHRFRKDYLKSLLKIALPLVPNFLIYWIFNSCDKLMIVNIIGTGESGIYSVGSKLGHCSQLIYTAFAGGWQFFAFSTMKEKNQIKNNSMVFEYLGVISFISTIFVFAWSKPIFNVLFEGDYINGYRVAPYLFLAPLLQMLYQVAANQFLVIKKTWPCLPILMSGAIINVILNMILIPSIGIEGAAIATLMGYAISIIICVFVLCKMKLHIISKRFIASIMLLIGYIIISKIFSISVCVLSLFAVLCLLIYWALYWKEIKFILGKNNEKYEGVIKN